MQFKVVQKKMVVFLHNFYFERPLKVEIIVVAEELTDFVTVEILDEMNDGILSVEPTGARQKAQGVGHRANVFCMALCTLCLPEIPGDNQKNSQ